MATNVKDDHRSSIGVVVATHAPLANALVETAKDVMGEAWDEHANSVVAVYVDAQNNAASAFECVSKAIAAADHGCGVLVLADLFGGSAANIALAQLAADRVEVVTGVNLAMVLKAFRHRQDWDSPAALGEMVAEAARQSVVVAGSLLASMPNGNGREASTGNGAQA